MKFRSIDAKRVSEETKIWAYNEGEYSIEILDENHAKMFVRCPGAMTILLWLSTIPGEDPRRGFEGKYWHWNGDLDKPTLTPSIGVGPKFEQWHGFMKNGRLEACE